MHDSLELVILCLFAHKWNSARGGLIFSAGVVEPHELSIVLCDDEYMTAVNAEWRGQNKPTDVLSFELPQDEFDLVRYNLAPNENTCAVNEVRVVLSSTSTTVR
jgi:ssRNA-specific RNase YbeY (16S rRNA maturation enzyme)